MTLSQGNNSNAVHFSFRGYQHQVYDSIESVYSDTLKSTKTVLRLAPHSQGPEMVSGAARYARDKLRAEGAKGRITIAKEIISQEPYNMQCW